MDLRQLEILRAIADSGSFTAAGERLHVSQSAISRQILLLEEEFKEPLFIRFGRRIQITPTGETLLQLSHRVFEDIRDTSASILDHQEEADRHARLVGGMTVCLYVFPPLLKEFRQRHPDVDIKVITGGHAATAAQAALGRSGPRPAHAADRRPGAGDGSGRFDEELLLVMPAGHRLASGNRPIPPRRSCASRSSCSRPARTRAA